MLLKFEGFWFSTPLYPNMGYYHVQLTPNYHRICTIVLTWDKYKYCWLPLGVSVAPDMFQEKSTISSMDSSTFKNIWTACSWKPKTTGTTPPLTWSCITTPHGVRTEIQYQKMSFGLYKYKYLGFWVPRYGIRQLEKKAETISNIQTPKTVQQGRIFVGFFNHYQDMWPRHTHIITPLKNITAANTIIKWMEVEKKGLQGDETYHWKRCSPCVAIFFRRVCGSHGRIKHTAWGCNITSKKANCALLPRTDVCANVIRYNWEKVALYYRKPERIQ